jgi:hypothetical protein
MTQRPTSVQHEIRRIWDAERARLRGSLVDGRWRAEASPDPFTVLDLTEANVALARGLSIDKATAVVAARKLAREFGVGQVRAALLHVVRS